MKSPNSPVSIASRMRFFALAIPLLLKSFLRGQARSAFPGRFARDHFLGFARKRRFLAAAKAFGLAQRFSRLGHGGLWTRSLAGPNVTATERISGRTGRTGS